MCDHSVLYAEDDENDRFFMEQAFLKMGVTGKLQIVSNGQLATEYLSGEGTYADRQKFPLPRLLLLDVKMPQMSGLEVLQWVRQRPEFGALTVVMFTSSTQLSDIEFCTAHGANAYLVKQSRSDQLSKLMANILSAGITEYKGGVWWMTVTGNHLRQAKGPPPAAHVGL